MDFNDNQKVPQLNVESEINHPISRVSDGAASAGKLPIINSFLKTRAVIKVEICQLAVIRKPFDELLSTSSLVVGERFSLPN